MVASDRADQGKKKASVSLPAASATQRLGDGMPIGSTDRETGAVTDWRALYEDLVVQRQEERKQHALALRAHAEAESHYGEELTRRLYEKLQEQRKEERERYSQALRSLAAAEARYTEVKNALKDSEARAVRADVVAGQQEANFSKGIGLDMVGGLQVDHVTKLLAMDDVQFVSAAYVNLLGRSADPSGLHYYVSRLRIGTDKVEIIDQLYRSSEAAGHEITMGGLRPILRKFRLSRRPVIGWLFSIWHGRERREQQQAMLTNHLGRIASLLDRNPMSGSGSSSGAQALGHDDGMSHREKVIAMQIRP